MSRQYNVKNVHIAFTTPLGIYQIKCRHEDGFEDDPSSESSSETIGSCGKKVYNVLPDGSVDIKLNLLYGSSENTTMWLLYEAWKGAKSEFPMSIAVTDENAKESFFYPNVSFKKRPSTKFSHESGTEATTWELKAEDKNYIKI